MDINAPLIKPIYNKETKTNIDPNGISILTEKSGLSIIDVDKPNDCPILDKLLTDCQWIHKTRKGYHFIFKKNDLQRNKQCGVIDVNTTLIHFVSEYKKWNEYRENQIMMIHLYWVEMLGVSADEVPIHIVDAFY